MQNWLKENHAPAWAALIGFALIAYWLSGNSGLGQLADYHQLAIGVLAAAVTLLVTMLVFETLWWIAASMFESPGKDSSDKRA